MDTIEQLYIERERMEKLAEEHYSIAENYQKEAIGIGNIIIKKETEKKMKKYIFTFGIGHKLGSYCQPIYAKNEIIARGKMVELHGKEWGFQYEGEDWENRKRNPEIACIMEQELEPIYVVE